MRNLIYPLNWEEIFAYVGFPAILKSNFIGPGNTIYKVYNPGEFFSAYDLTGRSLMILRSALNYEKTYRVYVIGREISVVSNYDPTKPRHLRHSSKNPPNPRLEQRLSDMALKICGQLKFDFNAVDIGLLDDELYAVDYLNPAPAADLLLMKEELFYKLTSITADYLVKLAME